MSTFSSFLLAILVLIGTTQGKSVSWYKCPSTCKLPNCRCASSTPPLPISEMPQLVVITSDDAVDQKVVDRMSKVTTTGKNSNGCSIPVTWFTTSDYSSCSVIQKRFNMGDEFADHTITHKELKPSTPKATVVKEIAGGRDYLTKNCKLPASKVTGYRSTYLTTNPQVRQVLKEQGFKYDSSTCYDFAAMDSRPYPFTMDYGIPDPSCKTCTPTESYPGVWQIPVYTLKYDGQMWTMDPGAKASWAHAEDRPVEDVMKSVFDAAYNGNRAPVPLYVHVYWLTNARIRGSQTFVKYALSKPDTYFVTMGQLVEYMQKPVPKGEMAAWLKARC